MSATDTCTETNLCHQAGDTLAFRLHVTTDGVDEDITGWEFFLTINRSKGAPDADAIINISVDSHTDAAGGVTIIQVEKEDTVDLSGAYYYSLIALKPDGYMFTIQHGLLTFEKRVKKAVA